jgi:hypothetical protein
MPRRKRTWLLVLLGVVIVGVASIWWAASAKSDFERRVGEIELGMSIQEIQVVMKSAQLAQMIGDNIELGAIPVRCVVWDEDGDEQLAFDFEKGRLASKQFARLTGINRLRALWRKWFRFAPPF